jgi:hypothetical protein
VPSLAKTIEAWHGAHAPKVQVVVATHSPLILASMEPIFDTKKDALWKLDLVDGDVRIAKDAWTSRGDVNRWLTSDVFSLASATNPATEKVLREAGELLMQPAPRWRRCAR